MQKKALLDTNILIHREASVVINDNIGPVFNWLDRLGYEKYVHPVSIGEIQGHHDERVRRSFSAKIASYKVLKSPAPMAAAVQALSDRSDRNENDRNDSLIINELYSKRVDMLITEDRGIARKADRLGIGDRVLTIEGFLEKVSAENPNLTDYSVLSVRKVLFGQVDICDSFFDSFRDEYPGFDTWFNRKSEENVYICMDGGRLAAFLYFKVESEREPYYNIEPSFQPKKRLKIGTFKVELNGYKLGERFLKIVFDNACKQRVGEIYVTIFPHSFEQKRLISLLEDFGFYLYGIKKNSYGDERIYVRDMTQHVDAADPMLTFPYVSKSARSFMVPIYPEYHTELLPDSILRTESDDEFIDNQPHRNAIRKVYVSRSLFRDLLPSDVIVFYRTGGYHKSVVTTLGIVDRIHTNIQNEEEFIRICRKRSVFSDGELHDQWIYKPYNRPFVVEFLYAYSFPKRPNMAALIQHGVIKDANSAPRGFEEISHEQFQTIIKLSEANQGIIVD